jgi:hypothetical protein
MGYWALDERSKTLLQLSYDLSVLTLDALSVIALRLCLFF